MSEIEGKINERPGYIYSATFGATGSPVAAGVPTADQSVRVKVEINGQIKIVAVCALCHKAFRLCSLDPSVTEEQMATAKYLGLADDNDIKAGTGADNDADKNKDTSGTDKKKEGSDSDKNKETADSDKNKDKNESDKKKKKSSGGSDQRRREQEKTSWTTHTPSHDDWDKKKKKDF